MGVSREPKPLPLDSSSDDNDWGPDESDWSSSDVRSTPSRFSLVALPAKVRNSVFKSRNSPPSKKTKDRSSTADTTRTSSASSTPRDSQERENVEKFRVFWDEKLRGTVDRLAGSLGKNEHQDDVFHLLLQLYAHQDVVARLYSSYDANAAELEFYIPQLCTFLLHGNYAKQHQLECFLMSRSGESLPFAHRLTWFLRSFCNDAREYQSEYLSVTASPDQENSDLISAIGMRAGVPALLMNSGLCVEEVSAVKPGNLERRRSIAFPVDKEMDHTDLATDESFSGHLQRKRNSMQDEARTDEGNAQQITLYKQTPKFVEELTDLAEQLIPTPRPQRNAELRKGLKHIQDKMLPSDVIYLPIGNSYHRVKAIQVDECFTFSTKERVPYFLCVEVLDYSVASPTAASRKRRRRKSKSARNQARGFCLKLPFKKSGVEVAPVDDSPVSSCTSPESAPSCTEDFTNDGDQAMSEVSPCGSSLPDIEEEITQEVSDSSARVQPTTAVVNDDVLDGEDGDDEREEDEHAPRKSLQEDADLQRVAEEQQERMGQWSMPRTRRRSSKEYSSSASARSGGQFDSFYSSWFSKKTQREAETGCSDTEMDAAPVSRSKSVKQDQEEKQPANITAEADANEVAVEDSSAAITAKPESVPTVADGAVAASSSGGGIFSLFAKRPKPVDTTVKAGLDEMKSEETVSSSSDQLEPDAGQINGEAAVTSTESVGIFASLFSKKTKPNAECATEAPDAVSVSSLEPSEAARSDSIEAEEADGEESDSKEALPSDNDVAAADGTDSVSSLEPSEEGLSDDIDAEDADGEETDSEMLASDRGSVSCEQVTAAVGEQTSKPNTFVSWFSRKPVPNAVADATSSAPVAQEETKVDESCSAELKSEDKMAANTASDEAFLDAPVAEGADASQDEVLPRQRSRDLSVSLDFADPSAWKDKFDLEDGLTDDEPDAEATDSDPIEGDAEQDAEAPTSDDEKPMIVFRERWSEKEARIRRESPFGDHPGWRLLSVIVKSNDDLRQEQFAAQLIAQCDRIFREYSLPLSLRPYNVIATSAKTGLIEAVPDTVSLDSLKRNDPDYTTLLDFYHRLHGEKDTAGFARAQRNFVESLAAYSIVCYVFQIKDRHNGNILLDTDGHVIHIDFGFLLTNSPGSNWNFERAPFKLTDEFVELMGGPRSSTFRYFRSLCIRAYLALRRNMDQIVLLVEMMLVGNADLPCFAGGKKAVIDGLRARLKPGARTSTCQVFVNQLIDQSINNWRTRWYDKYQRACLGIL